MIEIGILFSTQPSRSVWIVIIRFPMVACVTEYSKTVVMEPFRHESSNFTAEKQITWREIFLGRRTQYGSFFTFNCFFLINEDYAPQTYLWQSVRWPF